MKIATHTPTVTSGAGDISLAGTTAAAETNSGEKAAMPRDPILFPTKNTPRPPTRPSLTASVSRRDTLRLLAYSAVMGLIGWWLYRHPPGRFGYFPYLAGAVFMGSVATVSGLKWLRHMVRSGPQLTIGSDGVFHSGQTTAAVPWHFIRSVRLSKVGRWPIRRTAMIFLDLDEGAEPFLRPFIFGKRRALYLSGAGYDVATKDVLAIISSYLPADRLPPGN